jgi:hypothetical protein
MTHLDGDTLALVALAELDLSPAEQQHLTACPACAGELDALRRTVLIGRSAGNVALVEPADAVWGRIHAALGLSDAIVAPPGRSALADAKTADANARERHLAAEDPRLSSTADHQAQGRDAAGLTAPPPESRTAAVQDPAATARADGSPTAEPRPPAPVVDLPARRRRTWLPVAAAACAVGLVGGIAGGAWWQSTRSPAEAVIAQAQLDALPGWTASGGASVQQSADGRREVVVDLEGDTDANGLREVWLLTADASGLVSLGLLDGRTGRFSIPAGVDLAEFPVVDVSAEPADGNPAHSGDSIVRGTLAES